MLLYTVRLIGMIVVIVMSSVGLRYFLCVCVII